MAAKTTKKESLLIALRRGNAEKVRKIVADDNGDGGGEIHADMTADSAMNALLHRAARYGHGKVVQVLIDLNADANRTNKFGHTPLHHASVGGDAAIVQQLMDAGAGPNAADEQGRVPLHWAAGNGHPDAVSALLRGGAKANMADKDGWTPLHRCCQEKPPKVNKKKAKPEGQKTEQDPKEQEPEPTKEEIRAAIAKEDSKRARVAEILMAEGEADANAREKNGRQTPLHLCAMNGYAKTATVIVDKGAANVNAVNKISQTPLLYACSEQHLEMVTTLIELKADLGLANKLHWDWTPIHTAVMADSPDIVEALIAAGADRDARDGVGRDAKTLAEEYRKEKVVEYFKRGKAKGNKKS